MAQAQPLEDGDAHVVDGYFAPRPALEAAVMGVAVEGDGDRVPQQRLLEAAGSEERKYFRRLPLDSLPDRGVVQDGHALAARELREGRLELERFLDRLPHESLDDLLAPGLERPRPEASAHALDAGEADARDLALVPIDQLHPGIAEDALDLVGLVRFVVVIAEHRDNGYLLGRCQLFHED